MSTYVHGFVADLHHPQYCQMLTMYVIRPPSIRKWTCAVSVAKCQTDIDGSLFICQCLGAPKAFMIGDTNIVRLDFDRESVSSLAIV